MRATYFQEHGASDAAEARVPCARSRTGPLTSSVYRMILSLSEVYSVATNIRSASARRSERKGETRSQT